MHITLYKSALCPRCYIVEKHLTHLVKDLPDTTIETIDIAAHPLKSWKDGIRMIPAIKIGEEVLSSIYLSKKELITFVNKQSLS